MSHLPQMLKEGSDSFREELHTKGAESKAYPLLHEAYQRHVLYVFSFVGGFLFPHVFAAFLLLAALLAWRKRPAPIAVLLLVMAWSAACLTLLVPSDYYLCHVESDSGGFSDDGSYMLLEPYVPVLLVAWLIVGLMLAEGLRMQDGRAATAWIGLAGGMSSLAWFVVLLGKDSSMLIGWWFGFGGTLLILLGAVLALRQLRAEARAAPP
ncbi:MAG: hypothetical protein M5U26_08810 [Planctomycetota bacterium]|nr:hypothetical protein [Planctomycetota bacterium]